MAFPLLQVAFLALSAYGVHKSIEGQKEVAKASKKQERLRKKQADLEANREKRKSIREAIIARSQALSSATNQGAQFGSGLQGGFAQIQGQNANNLLGINQGQELSTQMFSLNRDIASGQQKTSTGQGYTSLGQMGMDAFGSDGSGTRLLKYFTGG